MTTDTKRALATLITSLDSRSTNEDEEIEGGGVVDWRVTLFGPTIQVTNRSKSDVESGTAATFLPTKEALAQDQFDYLAIFIGADYCPSCKEFAPAAINSALLLEHDKKCKTLFVSADRTEEAFELSCDKVMDRVTSSVTGIAVMPYDLAKTRALRDLWGLTSIPAFVILKNSSFDNSTPIFVANARNLLENDPSLDKLDWKQGKQLQASAVSGSSTISIKERIFKGGKYGKWYSAGHRNVNPNYPDKMYMDEHAVRIRAGILNTLAWMTVVGNHLGMKMVYITLPVVWVEMCTSLLFGMGIHAPISVLGHLLASIFQPKPMWKPAEPKRFAWTLGLIMVTVCLAAGVLHDASILNPMAKKGILWGGGAMCYALTWLEACCGWCMGCWMYNSFVVPWFGLEGCKECKL